MHKNLPPLPTRPYRFVRVSGNAKTGPIPVSSTAAQTCPDACPMKTNNEGGCYAASGNSAIHWRNLSNGNASTALDFAGFLAQVQALPRGQLWRMNEAGDFMPRADDPNSIDPETLGGIVAANIGRKGFTYTHHALTPENLQLIQEANAAGFTVNISTNNAAHADRVAEQANGKAPIVTLMTDEGWNGGKIARTPQGRMIVRCPAEYQQGMTCSVCQLCAVSTRRGIVGFTAHGTSKRRVITIASRKESD